MLVRWFEHERNVGPWLILSADVPGKRGLERIFINSIKSYRERILRLDQPPSVNKLCL